MVDTAREAFLALDDKVSLWYRTWGNPAGIPVVFVHGGPGNSVAHYKDINAKFFEADRYFVVEVDQRGTGNSTPSVEHDYRNMQHYLDISIAQMSNDFERLREHLNIDKWLVFGGSWGSTLGIDYAERYPDKCLGLIVRGLYLNTKKEFDAIYARKSFEADERRTKEFDIFFELAQQEVERRGEAPLDPNDSERFIRLYEAMIQRGDRDAMWRFYVFENNLVEEDASALLDPFTIVEDLMPEAMAVSFFEARLFLRGTFEDVVDLLGAVDRLKDVPTWVVQGTGDEVCPEIFAQQFVERLVEVGVKHEAHFVDAGHRASSDGIATALKICVDAFYDTLSR